MSNEITHPPHPVVLPAAPGWPIHPAMVTVADELASFRITRSLGVVRGTVVRATAPFTGLQALVSAGDEHFQQLAALRDQARFQAHLMMLEAAARVGANAVIAVRYDSAEIAQNMFELLAYGTAVWAEYIEGAAVVQAATVEPAPASSEIATRGSDELTKS